MCRAATATRPARRCPSSSPEARRAKRAASKPAPVPEDSYPGLTNDTPSARDDRPEDYLRSANPVARILAIRQHTASSADLARLAKDPDLDVRAAATVELDDREFLRARANPVKVEKTVDDRIFEVAGANAARRKELAGDPSPRVRAAVARVVAELEVVRRLSRDRAEMVRRAVLGNPHTHEAPEILRLMARDPDGGIRRRVYEAMARSPIEFAAELLRSPEERRALAVSIETPVAELQEWEHSLAMSEDEFHLNMTSKEISDELARDARSTGTLG